MFLILNFLSLEIELGYKIGREELEVLAYPRIRHFVSWRFASRFAFLFRLSQLDVASPSLSSFFLYVNSKNLFFNPLREFTPPPPPTNHIIIIIIPDNARVEFIKLF